MANTVIVKRSAVPGKVPLTTDLDLGEIAVNTHDGKMFTKRDNGAASIVEFGPGFPSGTKMLFAQTAAPTGWTKDTTHNNKALRVVSGTAGAGGSVAFTTAFQNRTTSSVEAGGTVAAHTLTTAQIPSHDHSFSVSGDTNLVTTFPNGQSATHGAQTGQNSGGTTISFSGSGTTNPTGGGGSHAHGFTGSSHSHTLDMRVQYVDVIIATKD